MIHKTPSSRGGNVYIVFELPSCVWADQISVTGDFNQWDRQALPMKQGRDGVWRACLELPAGKIYEFRYLIDGRWQTDHHADGTTDNSYGSHNSLLDLTSTNQYTVEHRLNAQVPESYTQPSPHFVAGDDSCRVANSVGGRPERIRIRPRATAA